MQKGKTQMQTHTHTHTVAHIDKLMLQQMPSENTKRREKKGGV